MTNILIVAPHPDDEILGCGGSIIKYIEKGCRVSVLYLSSGDSIEKIRETEANRVCDFLKIKDKNFMRLKGNKFLCNSETIDKTQKIFMEYAPNIIYCCHDQDADSEHKIAAQIIMESFWRYNSFNKKQNLISGLIFYEVHKPLSSYNLVEDISLQFDKKITALSFYKSQLSKSKIDVAITGLNQYRGEMHENTRFAEVFQIKRLHSILI